MWKLWGSLWCCLRPVCLWVIFFLSSSNPVYNRTVESPLDVNSWWSHNSSRCLSFCAYNLWRNYSSSPLACIMIISFIPCVRLNDSPCDVSNSKYSIASVLCVWCACWHSGSNINMFILTCPVLIHFVLKASSSTSLMMLCCCLSDWLTLDHGVIPLFLHQNSRREQSQSSSFLQRDEASSLQCLGTSTSLTELIGDPLTTLSPLRAYDVLIIKSELH